MAYTTRNTVNRLARKELNLNFENGALSKQLLGSLRNGGKTQDGRMTIKCGARLCIPGLARHFYTSFCRPDA